jgi:HSP20 family protein
MERLSRPAERIAPAKSTSELIVSEVSYGRFERELTLPEDIDAQHVDATYRHGMLDLVLPLSEGAKPHRMEVKAAPEAKQLHAA